MHREHRLGKSGCPRVLDTQTMAVDAEIGLIQYNFFLLNISIFSHGDNYFEILRNVFVLRTTRKFMWMIRYPNWSSSDDQNFR